MRIALTIVPTLLLCVVASTAAQDQDYASAALTNAGDPENGRKVFMDAERTKCATCHKVGKEGGEVGPDMSNIGGKFDRPHLIESLLEPSRQIVEGYRVSNVETKSGKIRTGIIKRQDEQLVLLVDAEGKSYAMQRSLVESIEASAQSIMPEGLEKQISAKEFTDLIAYMESLRTGGKNKNKFGAGTSGPINLPSGFSIETVATGLTGATAMQPLKDGRILICEQDGNLRVIKKGKLLEKPMLSIDVELNWERGLIGVTVSPDFPNDPYVYVCYVTDQPFTHHRISRFKVDGDAAVAGSEEVLLRGDDQSKLGGHVPAGHQGGALHFGNDGKLYVGIGEQTAGMPAQNLDTFQGKILRINPDGSIPQDNPFYEKADGKYRAIWAIGCRNPFTFAFQESTGKMLINDVGGKFEEINIGQAGANYGWQKIDHGPTDDKKFVGPLHMYPEASISGGDFCNEDSSLPQQYRGRYFFADFVHGWIKTIDPETRKQSQEFASGFRRPVDIRFAADGSLYVLLRNAWVVDGKFEGGTGSLMRISIKK